MPYQVKGPNADGKFEVVNTESGDVKAKHADKGDADKQVKVLHMLEKEHGE